MLQPQDVTEGQKVVLTFGNRKQEAVIVLASSNGYSLALEFEGLAGDEEGFYAGFMPVLWDDRTRTYRDLVKFHEVKLEVAFK